MLELANKFPYSSSTFSYCGRQRAIELAMKKEFPVLGIEADKIRWQHIDGKIRRELRNVFAVLLREAVPVIACHEVSTRTPVTTPRRQRNAFRLTKLGPARALGSLHLTFPDNFDHPLGHDVHIWPAHPRGRRRKHVFAGGSDPHQIRPSRPQRNRKTPESSSFGRLPTTSNNYSRNLRSLPTKSLRSLLLRSLGNLRSRSLCSLELRTLCSLCSRNLCSRLQVVRLGRTEMFR